MAVSRKTFSDRRLNHGCDPLERTLQSRHLFQRVHMRVREERIPPGHWQTPPPEPGVFTGHLFLTDERAAPQAQAGVISKWQRSSMVEIKMTGARSRFFSPSSRPVQARLNVCAARPLQIWK